MSKELIVPVDGRGADWPRRAATAINWLLTQIGALRGRVDALEGQASDHETRLDAVEASLASFDTRIGSIEAPGIRAVTADTALTGSDKLLTVDATGGNVTVSLPSLVAGRVFIVKRIDGSANAVTIDAAGSDLIDGAGSVSMPTQWQSFTLHGGAQWYVT